MSSSHKLLITGAAGYVGAMLADQFSRRDDVVQILCLDKEEQPALLGGNKKVIWISANTADDSWQEIVAQHTPDVVIHCAWQIRHMYGKEEEQWRWNVEGSKKIFDFVFNTLSVKRLIYFSTASIYGAFPSNTLEHWFKEEEPLRENKYLYGIEKRAVEEMLHKLVKFWRSERRSLKVFIVRPAAITGPRGRSMHHRFGLQSALSGTLKGSSVYKLVRLLVSFVPATRLWVRQFIHEDDVSDIIGLLSFGETDLSYEIFNITPPGKPVLAKDMATAVGKKVLRLPPFFIRIAFFFFWHGTRGRIPTSPGGWKFYAYPVLMDGAKLTEKMGYQYRFKEPREAFVKIEGRYAPRG